MTVSIRFMLSLKTTPELSLGKKTVTIELDDGSTFGDLLRGLDSHFGPTLADEIYDSQNHSVRETAKPIINGSSLHNLDGMDTILHPGDSILFIPLITAG